MLVRSLQLKSRENFTTPEVYRIFAMSSGLLFFLFYFYLF